MKNRLTPQQNRAIEVAWLWGELEPRADNMVYAVHKDAPKEPVCTAALIVEMADAGWFKPVAVKGTQLRFKLTALGRDVQAGLRGR